MSEPNVQHPPEGDCRTRLLELLDGYEQRLFRFVYILAGDRDAAMDCTQETFVRAYENLRKGKPVNVQWLYTVARNLVNDDYRRARRRAPQSELECLAAPDAAELGVVMRQAFARLTPDDRTVLYLVAVEGRTAGEVAEILGIKPTAARMRVSRARERFRRTYGGVA